MCISLQLLRTHPFLQAERIWKISEFVKAVGTLEVHSVSVLLPVELPLYHNFLAEKRNSLLQINTVEKQRCLMSKSHVCPQDQEMDLLAAS